MSGERLEETEEPRKTLLVLKGDVSRIRMPWLRIVEGGNLATTISHAYELR